MSVERRPTGFGWLPNRLRNHFIAFLAELAGTFLFLFFAFAGTQVASTTNAKLGPNPSVLLYISLAFGVSLAVNVWIFFRVSGGMFNPAVTLGLCLVGAVPVVRGIVVVIAQILGGVAAAAVVSAILPGSLGVRTSLSPGTSAVQGLFLEMFLTTQLVLTILMLAVEKHKATFMAPLGIGSSLFIAELAGVYFTGGSLNPARSFGPEVVARSFDSHHWIYWLGPCMGAALAALFYRLLKVLEYETANPGQDFDSVQAKVVRPSTDGAIDEEMGLAASSYSIPPSRPDGSRGSRGRSIVKYVEEVEVTPIDVLSDHDTPRNNTLVPITDSPARKTRTSSTVVELQPNGISFPPELEKTGVLPP